MFYLNQYTANEASTSDPSLQFVFEAFGQSFCGGADFYFILFNVCLTSENLSFIQEILQDINPNDGNYDNIFESLDGIWSTYHSWGPCYDYINAHLATKHVITVLHQQQSTNSCLDSFPFNYICDISDYESDFSLDGGLWSTVKYVPESITSISCDQSQITEIVITNTTINATTSIATTATPIPDESIPIVKTTINQNENTNSTTELARVSEGDWEMVEVRHEMAALQLVEATDYDEDDTGDNEEDEYYDDEDDTEYQGEANQACSNHNTTTVPSNTTVNVTKAPRPGISYKDMVLRPPPVSAAPDPPPAETITLQSAVERPKWRPKLVVTKVSEIRLDREYGPQSSTMVFDDDGTCLFVCFICLYIYIYIYIHAYI